VTDDTPDVPGMDTDTVAVADSLLSEAWRNRAPWEPEIRLLDRIGDAFATFGPRSLRELRVRERSSAAWPGK